MQLIREHAFAIVKETAIIIIKVRVSTIEE